MEQNLGSRQQTDRFYCIDFIHAQGERASECVWRGSVGGGSALSQCYCMSREGRQKQRLRARFDFRRSRRGSATRFLKCKFQDFPLWSRSANSSTEEFLNAVDFAFLKTALTELRAQSAEFRVQSAFVHAQAKSGSSAKFLATDSGSFWESHASVLCTSSFRNCLSSHPSSSSSSSCERGSEWTNSSFY